MARFSGVICLIFLCQYLSMTPAAEGGLVISIGNVIVPAGGTGTADVTIMSDSPMDLLGFYNAEFIITGDGTQAWFVDPQPQDELALGTYLFAGPGSSQIDPAVLPSGLVDVTKTNYLVFDFANSDLTGPFTHLLAQLQFATDAGAPTQSFTISLVPGSLASTMGTFFTDMNFDTEIPFSVVNGTLNLTASAQAVPEPASICLTGLAVLGLGTGSWCRRKLGRSRSPDSDVATCLNTP